MEQNTKRSQRKIRSLVGLVLISVILSTSAAAQQLDNYRSITSGNWHAPSTWQRHDGLGWVAATTYPTASTSTAIIVRTAHTVTLTDAVGSIAMDDLIVEAGAQLTSQAGCHTFNDGAAAVDATILGTYTMQSACGGMGCCGAVVVGSGGLIALNGPAGSSAIFAPLSIQAGGTLTSNTYVRAPSPLVNSGTMTINGYLDEVRDLTNNGSIAVLGAVTIFHASVNAQFTNNGALTVTNGNLNLNSANATFNNTGTLHVNGTSNGQFTNNGAGGQAWNNSATGIININNSALKGIGCCVPFNNAGAFNLNAGQVNQSTVFNHNGSLTVAGGATFNHFAAGSNSGTYTIAAGGSLIGSMSDFTGASITNNGSIAVASLRFGGTGPQTLTGTGSITSLVLNNANGLVLGGTQTVTGTLTLANGRISLGNNDLVLSSTTLAGLVGGNATNHIVTNGSGSFRRNLPVGGSGYSFPIGTGASYLPVTLSHTSGPAERFGARVQNDVYSDHSTPGTPTGGLVVNEQVEHTWVITEQIAGGNQATVQVQWNAADEGANFGRANSGLHGYNGTDWVPLALGAAGGSDPYTRSATGVTVFREFTVADGESTLPFVCNSGLVPGAPCNDNDVCTINDVVDPGCQCVGTLQDTDGDGACDVEDGCPNDPLKTIAGACGCGIADTDTDGDGIADCNDTCPSQAGQVGSACDADPGAGFMEGSLNSTCICVPSSTCTENLTMEVRADALSSEVSWEILAQGTNEVVCQMSIPVDGITTPVTEDCCLPVGCYRLRVMDEGGDGFVSGGITGGYQLRESGANGRRIIDNFGNYNTGAQSALASTYENGGFCVPVGDDKLIFSSCDKLDWVANKFIVAVANPLVSEQFGVSNATSGYEFWFFDPNGAYSFRRFRNHATSDGFGSGATRACHFKVNGWFNGAGTPHLPVNMLLNVRVRSRVAGVNLPFGAACLFKIDPVLASCPRVKLQDDPANVSDYSCGVFRNFGGSGNAMNRIYASRSRSVNQRGSSGTAPL